MKLNEFFGLSQEEIYKISTDERIKHDSPIEPRDQTFPIGARAYLWTNEGLCDLEKSLKLDLTGRDMLLVGASGDPFPVFAALGAKRQVGFDTSHRAILWDEMKVRAIDVLDFEGFRRFAGLTSQHSNEMKYYNWTKKGLTPYAKSVYDPLFSAHKTLRGIMENGNLFRGGYASSRASLNVYSQKAEEYERARKALRKSKVRLVPGRVDKVFELIDEPFNGFYASNIMDHFRNDDGVLDTDVETTRKFLGYVDAHMQKDSIMIFEFEWSDEVRQNAEKVLGELGYKMKLVPGDKRHGCGTMAVARRE